MTIEAGQAIPQATFQIKTDEGVDAHIDRVFCQWQDGAALGAFTSTCSASTPEFVARADDLRAAGVDRIACLAVNDAHVRKPGAIFTARTAKST